MNLLFELDRLRQTLLSKGLPDGVVEGIVNKANADIQVAMRQHAESAMQRAIEVGVQKDSAEFINQLQVDSNLMQVITESGNMNFPEPPKPMLPFLLKNAKPMNDGSGVYKVIPVGSSGHKPKQTSTSIYDSWKQINAERAEAARDQYKGVAPKASKFRTATSKQDPNSRWVIPAKDKDFADDVRNINQELEANIDEVIREIVRSYEEGF